jgi:hypothetical protein
MQSLDGRPTFYFFIDASALSCKEKKMVTKSNALRPTPAAGSGVASGQHHGLHRPDVGQPVEQALDQVDLADQGEVAEDQWRDRRSRGAPPAKKARGNGVSR